MRTGDIPTPSSLTTLPFPPGERTRCVPRGVARNAVPGNLRLPVHAEGTRPSTDRRTASNICRRLRHTNRPQPTAADRGRPRHPSRPRPTAAARSRKARWSDPQLLARLAAAGAARQRRPRGDLRSCVVVRLPHQGGSRGRLCCGLAVLVPEDLRLGEG